MIQLIIKGAYFGKNCFPGMNEYTGSNRTNKYAGAKTKKKFEKIAITEIAKQWQQLKMITEPIEVRFEFGEWWNGRDLDNILSFATKTILDAMQYKLNKKLQNDNLVQKITGEKKIVSKGQDPYIKVEVEYYDT